MRSQRRDKEVSIQEETEEMAREFTNWVSKSMEKISVGDLGNVVGNVGGSAKGINLKMPCTADVARSMSCSDVSTPDFQMRFDWRQNATLSMSDWTVVVYDGRQSAVYNVHKSEVGHGPRRSGFFAMQFEEDDRAEKTDPNTEVYLPSRAADTFPELLDYIYHGKLSLSTASAPALKHLSNKFDVRPLYESVTEFIRKDMNLKTAPLYAKEADLVIDKDILDDAIKILAENFGRVDMSVFTKLPPKLFKEVLSSPHIDVESEFLSTKVAQFMRLCKSDITDEMLYMLTHPQIMPTISPDEAFFFLNQGLKHPDLINEGGKVSLRSRCIEAVSRSWMTTLAGPIAALKPDLGLVDDTNFNHEIAFNYSSLPAEMKVEVFEAAILAAKSDVESSKRHF